MKKKRGKKLKIALLSFLLIVVFLFGGMAITFASITKNAVLDSNLLPKQNVSSVFYDINGLEIQTVGFLPHGGKLIEGDKKPIADNGKERATRTDTWQCRADELDRDLLTFL